MSFFWKISIEIADSAENVSFILVFSPKCLKNKFQRRLGRVYFSTKIMPQNRENWVFSAKIALQGFYKAFLRLLDLQAYSVTHFIKRLDGCCNFCLITKFWISLIFKKLKRQIPRTNGSYIFFYELLLKNHKNAVFSLESARRRHIY